MHIDENEEMQYAAQGLGMRLDMQFNDSTYRYRRILILMYIGTVPSKCRYNLSHIPHGRVLQPLSNYRI